MKKHGLWIVAILVFVGIILGTLGTWSLPLGYGISAFWPAFVVQTAGSAWFGGWGVLASVLFPILTNTLTNVGLSGIFGFIPANLIQGLIPGWAFRYFRVDQALPGRKELGFYAMWGALIPALGGGLLGSVSVVLLGGASWSEYPLLVVKWAAPHIVVSLLIGIPIMRELTPIWRDLGLLVKDWWAIEQGTGREFSQRFQDAPILFKVLLAMCISGLGPLLILSLLELAQNGGNSASSSMTPLFLTISLVASVLAVGLLSRETVRPLQELKEQVNSLIQHRDSTFTVERADEIGQLGQAFAFLLDDWRHAADLLKASESRFRLLAENSTDMISRHDSQGTYLYASPASRILLGYEPEELIGHSAFEFVHPKDVPAVDQSRLSIVDQPILSTTIFRARHKNGDYIWLETTSRTIKNEDNEVIEIHAASRDVTERKQAEIQLKRRVKELDTIHQAAQVMQKLYSLSQLAPEIIRILETMLEYKFGAVLLIDEANDLLIPFALSDQNLGPEFVETDKANICSLGIKLGLGITGWVAQNGQSVRLGDIKNDPRYIAAREGINSELCVPLNIGEKIIGVINVESTEPDAYTETDQFVLEAVAAQIAASVQNARMFEAIQKELNERKRTEEALIESENLYRKMIENSPLGMHFYKLSDDDQLIFVSANPTADKLLGVDNSQFIGKTIQEAFPALIQTEVPGRYRDAAVKGIPWSTEQIAYEENQIQGAFEVSAFQTTPENMVAVFADITKRKRAEEALRESTAKLETMIQVSPLAIVLVDLNGNVQLWNSSAERIFGWTAQEVIGHPNPIVPANKQNEYGELANQIMQGDVLNDHEAIRQRKDGSLIDVSISSSQIYDDVGNATGRMAIIADITARKRVEEALRESEEHIHSLYDNAMVGMYRTTPDGRILLTNPAGVRMLGYDSFEEIATHNLEKDGSGSNYDRSQFRERMKRDGIITGLESTWKRKDGSTIYIRESATAIKDSEGNILYYDGTFEDITERKRAEEQIQKQLERLNALRNIDDAIKSSDDLRFTLKVFLGEVAAQLKIDAVSVLLFNKNSLTLDYTASYGFHSSALQHTKLGIGQGYAGRVILDRKTIHIPDLTKAANKLTETLSLAGENFTAYIGSPLIAKGQVVGVLEIFHRLPLSPAPEWFNFLNMLASQAAIAIDNAQLFENLQKSNFDLTFAYDATIEGWSRAMDLRDRETEGHTQRVTSLTVRLAQKMGIPDSEIIHIRRGALLHDIGKMGVPDNILLKPGKLTPEEWEIMRQHTNYAVDMLVPIHYLKPALDIPKYHHEKWDGTGYPHNLKGNEIPLPARIFAVVDVWDAVTSDRPYRSKWSDNKAMAHIKSEAGRHFDPKVVEMFLPIVSSK